jgi:hypothetical protein
VSAREAHETGPFEAGGDAAAAGGGSAAGSKGEGWAGGAPGEATAGGESLRASDDGGEAGADRKRNENGKFLWMRAELRSARKLTEQQTVHIQPKVIRKRR